MAVAVHLSNVQQELLKIYSKNIPDNELLKLKRVMADFFKKELLHETSNYAKEQKLKKKEYERLLSED